MIYFLWLIFGLFVLMFSRMLFFHKDRPIPEQTVVKAKNGKTKIVILRNK